jgi:hypothetical protein
MSVKSKDWVQNDDIPVTEDDDWGVIMRALSEKGRAYDIRSYFENDTCIYFRYKHGKSRWYIVFNKQTQKTYRYQSVINDVNYNYDETVYNLMSANSKFAYDWMYANTVLSFLEKGKFSSELAQQLELLTLDEEGFVVLEYEFK